MHKFFRLAIATSLVLGISFGAANATDVLSPFKHEAVAVSVKPGWHVVTRFAKSGMFVLQLIPATEDAKNPKTLINVVTYIDAQKRMNAKQFAKQEEANAPKVAKPGKMDFTYVDQANPNDVTYQIALRGNPQFPDQFEVHRVLVGKDGLHTVIYHAQPANQPQSQIKEMMDVIKTARLVDPPKEAPKEK